MESPSALSQRVVFVIDGSEAMVGSLPAITETLSGLPEGVEFALLIASDLAADAVRVEKGSREVYEHAADKLRRLKAVGGQDNVPALARAWDLAAESNAGAVVWIHGPQPLLLENAEQLKQRLDRRPHSPLFYEVQTEIGPNRVVEKLDGIDAVKSVPIPTGLVTRKE